MWHLIALIAGFIVLAHCTVTSSAQMKPPVPTTPKWMPPEHDWEFNVYEFPNSLTQPDRCNQPMASYLCDPKSLLEPEYHSVLTKLLNVPRTSFMSVAIVHKIKVLQASELNNTMRSAANTILNNLASSNQSMSQEGSLLFISDQDNQTVLVSTDNSRYRCIDLEHDNSTALFKNGQLPLSEYVSNVTTVFINSKCLGSVSLASSVVILLAVLFSIVLPVKVY